MCSCHGRGNEFENIKLIIVNVARLNSDSFPKPCVEITAVCKRNTFEPSTLRGKMPAVFLHDLSFSLCLLPFNKSTAFLH